MVLVIAIMILMKYHLHLFNSSTSSGIYILKLYLDDYTASKKIIYLKWKKTYTCSKDGTFNYKN